jgi:hypothetical protein
MPSYRTPWIEGDGAGGEIEEVDRSVSLWSHSGRSRLTRRRLAAGASVVLAPSVVLIVVVVGADRVVLPDSSALGSTSTEIQLPKCTRVAVHLEGVDAYPGAAVSAGVLVKESVSSSHRCSYGGYPSLAALLDNGSKVRAAHRRSGVFGGAPRSRRRPLLPMVTLGTRPTVVSFTLEWVTGNGGGSCTQIRRFHIQLPGARSVQVVSSLNNGGSSLTTYIGIYCSHVSVTPIVQGSTGRLHFGIAPPAA